MPVNHQILLAARPDGTAGPENFRLVEAAVPTPGDGGVLVRHLYLSLDPYMRGRMNDARSYTAAQKLDEVMGGGTVGEVIASSNPDFDVGDRVVGMGGWQEYGLSDGKGLRKIDNDVVPIQAYLGPVGMPGVTAWIGLATIVKPKAGETIVVSAATGAVGTVAGQLAKLAGARIVGIAGGKEKCRYGVDELGFDACIDHRGADFARAFKNATPDGIDGVFENVGGEPLNLCLARLTPFARLAICGLVASGYDGTPTPIRNIGNILTMRALMQGFIVSERMDLWPQALGELAGHVVTGRIKYRESIVDGLSAAPAAFFGMLKGENFGKMLVKLG